MSDFSVHVIDSLEQLRELEDHWNELLSCSSADTIFLTWEWVTAWSESFIGSDRALFVVVLKRKNELICIAPWFINRVRYGPIRLRRVEFIGGHGVGSDYLDVIARVGKEKEAARCLYDFLLKEIPDRWDCLLLRNVPANSIFHNKFVDEFERAGKHIQVSLGSYCPVVILPETKEDFIAVMRPHRRKQCNRHWRMIRNTEGVEYKIERNARQDEVLGRFLVFYEGRWGKKDDGYWKFLENFTMRAQSKGWIEVESIRRQGAYIAAILHMNYNGTKFSYLTAVDKGFNKRVSVGNALVCLSLMDAIERNMGKYNFLKGGEPYKYHWANSGEQLLDINYHKRRLVSVARFVAENARTLGKILLR